MILDIFKPQIYNMKLYLSFSVLLLWLVGCLAADGVLQLYTSAFEDTCIDNDVYATQPYKIEDMTLTTFDLGDTGVTWHHTYPPEHAIYHQDSGTDQGCYMKVPGDDPVKIDDVFCSDRGFINVIPVDYGNVLLMHYRPVVLGDWVRWEDERQIECEDGNPDCEPESFHDELKVYFWVNADNKLLKQSFEGSLGNPSSFKQFYLNYKYAPTNGVMAIREYTDSFTACFAQPVVTDSFQANGVSFVSLRCLYIAKNCSVIRVTHSEAFTKGCSNIVQSQSVNKTGKFYGLCFNGPPGSISSVFLTGTFSNQLVTLTSSHIDRDRFKEHVRDNLGLFAVREDDKGNADVYLMSSLSNVTIVQKSDDTVICEYFFPDKYGRPSTATFIGGHAVAVGFVNEDKVGPLLVLGWDDTKQRFCNVIHQPELNDSVQHDLLAGHSRGIARIEWSDEEKLLVTTGFDGYKRTWSACTGQYLDYHDSSYSCNTCTAGNLCYQGRMVESCPPNSTPENHVCPVPSGYYLDVWPALQCQDPYYCVNGERVECDAMGHYLEPALKGATACTICPKGSECNDYERSYCEQKFYQDNEGKNKCSLCTTNGYYATELTNPAEAKGAAACSKCPVGRYCQQGVLKQCLDGHCAVFLTNDVQYNQEGSDGCRAPNRPYYAEDGWRRTCEDGGYTVYDNGSAALSGATGCKPCIAGNECTKGAMTKCTNRRWSAKGAAACKSCIHGIVNSDLSECNVCPVGTVSDFAFYSHDESGIVCGQLTTPYTSAESRCLRHYVMPGTDDKVTAEEYHTACGFITSDEKVNDLFSQYGSTYKASRTLDLSGSYAYACAQRTIGAPRPMPRAILAVPDLDSGLSNYLTVKNSSTILLIQVMTGAATDTEAYTLYMSKTVETSDSQLPVPWDFTDFKNFKLSNKSTCIIVARRDEHTASVNGKTKTRPAGSVGVCGLSTDTELTRRVPTVGADFDIRKASLPTGFNMNVQVLTLDSKFVKEDKTCAENDDERTFSQWFSLATGTTLLAMSTQPTTGTPWTLFAARLVNNGQCHDLRTNVCETGQCEVTAVKTDKTTSCTGSECWCWYRYEYQFGLISCSTITVTVEDYTTTVASSTSTQATVHATSASLRHAGHVAVCSNITNAKVTCTVCNHAIRDDVVDAADVPACPAASQRVDAFAVRSAGVAVETKCPIQCTVTSPHGQTATAASSLTLQADVVTLNVVYHASISFPTADTPAHVASVVPTMSFSGILTVYSDLPEINLAVGTMRNGACVSGGPWSQQADIIASECVSVQLRVTKTTRAAVQLQLRVMHSRLGTENIVGRQLVAWNGRVVVASAGVVLGVLICVVGTVVTLVVRKSVVRKRTKQILQRLNVSEIFTDYVAKLKDIMVDPLQVEVTGPVLGRGGFGTVIRGTFGGAPVAIKKLHEHLVEDSIAVESIVSEAVVQTDLRHPHLVGFYGCVALGGTLGLVHEFCGDGSLKGACYGHSFAEVPLVRRLEWLRQVASALAYLHNRGIAHRDLKAVNVLLADGGASAKLADLGLARDSNNSARATGMTMALGTPAWLAPEVIMKDDYDEFAADVYGFAIMIWEVLAGKEPFADLAVFSIAISIVDDELRPPINNEWPSEICTLLTDCWKADPSQRPSSLEVADVLGKLLQEPIH